MNDERKSEYIIDDREHTTEFVRKIQNMSDEEFEVYLRSLSEKADE